MVHGLSKTHSIPLTLFQVPLISIRLAERWLFMTLFSINSVVNTKFTIMSREEEYEKEMKTKHFYMQCNHFRTNGVSDQWCFGPLVLRTNGVSDYR